MCTYVLSAVSLLCPPLRGLAARVFPYTNLSAMVSSACVMWLCFTCICAVGSTAFCAAAARSIDACACVRTYVGVRVSACGAVLCGMLCLYIIIYAVADPWLVRIFWQCQALWLEWRIQCSSSTRSGGMCCAISPRAKSASVQSVPTLTRKAVG